MNHHAAYQGQIRLTMKKQFICLYPCDLINLCDSKNSGSQSVNPRLALPENLLEMQIVDTIQQKYHRSDAVLFSVHHTGGIWYQFVTLLVMGFAWETVLQGYHHISAQPVSKAPTGFCSGLLFLMMLANILRITVSLWIKAQVCLQQWFSIRDIFDFHSWGGGEEKENILQYTEYSSAPELPGRKC